MNRSGVSPWIRALAYATPLCVLPSALWRLKFVATGEYDSCPAIQLPWYEPLYIISLSVVSFAAALLTLGLVSEWGEVFPGWIPVIGNRRVPILAAVIPATIGVLILTSLYLLPVINRYRGWVQPAMPAGCQLPWEGSYGWVVAASYAPILLWAPMLAIVTWSYYRRRTSSASPGAA